jgi:hypothetical protein
MDYSELARQYQAKTDEELLQLAAQQGRLTEHARLALRSEMSKRRIVLDSTVDSSEWHQPSKNGLHSDRKGSESANISTGEFLEEVFRCYHRNRWIFLRLVFPAVLMGYISATLGLHEAPDRTPPYFLAWDS